MIENILSKNEGKTLEFKETARSLERIIKTVIAFANTAGGTIIIGVKDKTKEIVGIKNSLLEEERLANGIAESITPLLLSDIEIQTYRNKEVIILNVYHGVGPYYLKSAGPEKGVYVRLGSTNRQADAITLHTLRLLAKNMTFDELPHHQDPINALDWSTIKEAFDHVGKVITNQKCKILGLLTDQSGTLYPTFGGILLFGIDRNILFPNAIVRCARFKGTDKVHFLDHVDIDTHLPLAIDLAIDFIKKHSSIKSIIGKSKRLDIPQYPPVAVREMVINALLHTDYSIRGATITIAVFDDRIEITNPGSLPFGMTIEQALTGSSRIRNHVIGRVFRELKFIEQWGTGIKRIRDACGEYGLQMPQFQELNNQFKAILYSTKANKPLIRPWQEKLLEYLKINKHISSKDAANFWSINIRTARERLKQMSDMGLIQRIGTSQRDPYAVYVLV